MSNTIIVFAKNPEWGKVKTRLAATIGNDKALEAYKLLVKHTESVIESTNIPVAVYFTNYIDEQESFGFANGKKHIQIAGDLGAKMKQAFEEQFNAGHNKVVIVGTDCYELRKEHLIQAFEALDTNNVVIGPANDGGYYLLGMNSYIPALFDGIHWSTETVLDETIAVIKKLNKQYTLLETLVDVDNEDELGDLKPLLFNKI